MVPALDLGSFWCELGKAKTSLTLHIISIMLERTIAFGHKNHPYHWPTRGFWNLDFLRKDDFIFKKARFITNSSCI